MSLESGYSTDLSVPVPAESRNITGSVYGTRGVRELHVEYNRPRNRPRALQGERCKESASVIGDTGRRSARSAQPGNRREPGFYWRSFETPRSGDREPLRFLFDF